MEKIAKILPAVFRRHARRDHPPVVEVLLPLWAQVAGKAVAAHARPAFFHSGRLTLSTSCPTWAAQLGQLQGQILAAVNSFLGGPLVRDLRVRLVSESLHRAEAKQRIVPAQVASSAATEADRLLPDDDRDRAGCEPDTRERALPALDGLDAETAHVLQSSYAKYFARAH